jgi:hypothetical protein
LSNRDAALHAAGLELKLRQVIAMKQTRKFGVVLALLVFCGASSRAQQAGDNSQPAPNAVTAKDSADSAVKAKKVWTDDDVRHGASEAANPKPATKSKTGGGNPKDSQAAKLKEQLAKLQSQLDDTDAKLAELEKFNGENASDTAIKLNRHLDRTSLADQIVKLQFKKKQLQEQIQNIYDQARHSGIEPGALR